MAATKFQAIFKELEQRIKDGSYQGTLPTESVLTQEFQTSRNTIRRAITLLGKHGYVYSVKGRGVVILENFNKFQWAIGADSFAGLLALNGNNKRATVTKVVRFKKILVDADLATHTPFGIDEVLYEVVRVRIIDQRPLTMDYSYFRANQIPPLTTSIVQHSIYEYLTSNGVKIAAAKRRFSVISASEEDYHELDLNDNNCVGVLENLVYNDLGKLFEYTEIHFIPEEFSIGYFAQNDTPNHETN
ncbi:GntR family transcriptional regulator [Lapidilactobacillus gannanensis]|jgi:GntR family trehalose operon transcriptional repressor|uniref:GntR family transcriptional regulator n=1 Tax=Lapidilactobacillus gannanensis TaxID=2486002 RepID=A0ABW4BKI0_9LACO|nr:GntR family transcriptional regulator [Lapidilactobacillus gannanensis]MCH4057680.1 GntR family transcriptional regulator [Lactobacillaceae bacterium]